MLVVSLRGTGDGEQAMKAVPASDRVEKVLDMDMGSLSDAGTAFMACSPLPLTCMDR